jgi:hypothetical protein
VVIEASLRRAGLLEKGIEIRTTITSVLQVARVLRGAYLYSFSSSITCMPCSYCSLVGASPTAAKWPFIVITEGAVALEAAEGRRGEFVTPLLGGDVVIARRLEAFLLLLPAIEGAKECGR